MTTIIICLSVIICVGFVCASFIHVHTKDMLSTEYSLLSARMLEIQDQLNIKIGLLEEKYNNINAIAEDARKQLTAHNVAQGFKIGK